MPLINFPNFLAGAWTHPDYLKRTENFVMDCETVLKLREIFNELMEDCKLPAGIDALKNMAPVDCKKFLDALHDEIAENKEMDRAAVRQEFEICGFKTVTFCSYDRAKAKIIALKEFLDRVENEGDGSQHHYNVTYRRRFSALDLTLRSKEDLSRHLEDAGIETACFGGKKNDGQYYRRWLRLFHQRAAQYKNTLNKEKFQTVGNFYRDSERRAKGKILALQELLALSTLCYTSERQFIKEIQKWLQEQYVIKYLSSNTEEPTVLREYVCALEGTLKKEEPALKSGETICVVLADGVQMYVSLKQEKYSETIQLYDAQKEEILKIEGGYLADFFHQLSIMGSCGQ